MTIVFLLELLLTVLKYGLIFGLLSAEYVVFLYNFLKEWRKNPHWSFSCCLALLLPLNDLQGEIRGLAGKNVLKTQLQTGQFEMVTLHAAVKDSGAIDVTFEENEEGDDEGGETVEMKDAYCHGVECSRRKCDQGTQTVLSSLSLITDVTVAESIEETYL